MTTPSRESEGRRCPDCDLPLWWYLDLWLECIFCGRIWKLR
jgi:hypothetical protein